MSKFQEIKSAQDIEHNLNNYDDDSRHNSQIHPPRFRRTTTLFPGNVDDYMKKIWLDFTSFSNSDIITTTQLLRTGKYSHPRLKQLAAAARYGYMICPEEAFQPELWLDNLQSCHNYYANRINQNE